MVEAGVVLFLERCAWRMQRVHDIVRGLMWWWWEDDPRCSSSDPPQGRLGSGQPRAISIIISSSRMVNGDGASSSSSAPLSSDGDREVAELVASLQARLESSGEWQRLLKTLRKGLQDSEWDSNLREYARGALRHTVQ